MHPAQRIELDSGKEKMGKRYAHRMLEVASKAPNSQYRRYFAHQLAGSHVVIAFLSESF